MSERVKVAVIGVGNNVSALVQGIALSRTTGSLDGVRRPTIGRIGAGDVDFVAAFATSPEKIGRDLSEAVFLPPNKLPADRRRAAAVGRHGAPRPHQGRRG